MAAKGSTGERVTHKNLGFIDIVFSWSLEDIFNDNLYKDQVEKIPDSFESMEQYFGSYLLPLLDETRAEMCSSMELIHRAPYAEVTYLNEAKPHGKLLFDVNVGFWRNRFGDRGKEPYRTLPGDILVITDCKPETASDLQRVGRTWTFSFVTNIQRGVDDDGDNSSATSFKVKALEDITSKYGMHKSLFVVYLINVSSNRRIWNALHKHKHKHGQENLKIIKEVLQAGSTVEESCSLCSSEIDGARNQIFPTILLSQLNEPQKNAVLACLNKIQCKHKSHVELIWGPPGTGKTKTVSVLLFTLLRMKCRTLTCSPTNIAITEVAGRVLKLVKEATRTFCVADDQVCSLGDILVFGNKERLKVDYEIQEIFLDYRVKRLTDCFGPLGWHHCFTSMIAFLEDWVSQYHVFLENESIKAREKRSRCKKALHKSFLEYARERFASTALPLRRCVSILYTHIPKVYFVEHTFQDFETLFGLLDSFENSLFRDDVVSKEVEELFSRSRKLLLQNFSYASRLLRSVRGQCLSVMKALRDSLSELKLPSTMNKDSIIEFCFQNASLLFSTASSSNKLFRVEMKPLNVLVIDEAAQLKECESAIPLQLPGIAHSVLVGDEWQLPAVVKSNVSNEAGFGRSLFQRLSTLGCSKHLLSIQYRMHPSISCFPNARFYRNQILDAAVVMHKNYERRYLPWPMFGPYSFLNVSGRDDMDDVGRSRRNMVEVAVVQRLVQMLFKAWDGSNRKLSIGIISPYAAQVVAIQEKLGKKYDKFDGFAVKVKSVDGFQGGEEDVIIISTVRSNYSGAIGFLSSSQRSNVALTRARHSLWILGNGRTLAKSGSVWELLVNDAKARHCFFNADKNNELAEAVLDAMKDFNPNDLLNRDSLLFKNARWKVLFTDYFRSSFGKLKYVQTKKSVLDLLLKLSSGWRPKKRNVDLICESSSMVLKKFKVEGLYIICSIEVVKEQRYTQVLKAWDLLPWEGIGRLIKRLDGIWKCLELGQPHLISSSLSQDEGRNGAVDHLLSDRVGRELELPFELTNEELEIISFQRSSFMLGRSGTGKTTVLTMKMFKREQLFHLANEGLDEVDRNNSNEVFQENRIMDGVGGTEATLLHQLFVTDVLLYNFFGSSPLKSHWRAVYQYMEDQGSLDANWSFPSLKPEKHNILCSELKQLYVAISRTRQRLWICDNMEEFSRAMFDYWKKRGLVQARKLDNSLLEAMQVASNPEEWKPRGYKLLHQGNYVMATTCFEKAKDMHGEKLAKAFGLRDDADRFHGVNPEMASTARRQAAEILGSIGKAEHAAECFYLLNKEYKKSRSRKLISNPKILEGIQIFNTKCVLGCLVANLVYKLIWWVAGGCRIWGVNVPKENDKHEMKSDHFLMDLQPGKITEILY
ncbi:hypothetical protein PTKIN_Ptkin17bG0122700 [Pterospermum kingtungense]